MCVDVEHRAIPQRVFPRRCLTDIQPFDERVGWRGDWNLKSRFSLKELPFSTVVTAGSWYLLYQRQSHQRWFVTAPQVRPARYRQL